MLGNASFVLLKAIETDISHITNTGIIIDFCVNV